MRLPQTNIPTAERGQYQITYTLYDDGLDVYVDSQNQAYARVTCAQDWIWVRITKAELRKYLHMVGARVTANREADF